MEKSVRKGKLAETAVQVLDPISVPTEKREVYITVKETAEFLRLSEISIRRLLTKKKLRRFKCGARTLIRLKDAEALIREA